MKLAAALAAADLAAAPAALAQNAAPGMDHSGMNHGAPAGVDEGYAKAWSEAMTSMHADMNGEATNDPDGDFLKGMIPHHQGAIDMARVELRYGKDARVKALAERIIAAQEAEIAEMKRWIAERN